VPACFSTRVTCDQSCLRYQSCLRSFPRPCGAPLPPSPPPPNTASVQDCRPGYLALAAAHLGVARRAALEEASAAAAAGAGPPPLAWDPGSVRKGPWLGQVVRRSDTGAVMCVNQPQQLQAAVMLHLCGM
jgi:hypothetical protein